MYGLDLFSGIGGITKALEGYVTPVAYCENDRYAQAVLLSRMAGGELPWAPIWDDVRTLKGEMLQEPEIIYGGFPCTDISVTGRGAGLAGKQSGLFFEIIRLADEIRPRFVFLENVPAIRKRGGSVVAGELARRGYDCRWITLSAAKVGANHRRNRWWLLAHAGHGSGGNIGASQERDHPSPKWPTDHHAPGRSGEQSSLLANALRGGRYGEPRNQGQESPERGRARQGGPDVADTQGKPERAGLRANESDRERRRRLGDGCGQDGMADPQQPGADTLKRRYHANTTGSGWWQSEPNVGRVAHGIPFRVDRIKCLGNAVVPAQAREAFERLMGLK